MTSQRTELARYGVTPKLISEASNDTLVAIQSVGPVCPVANAGMALLFAFSAMGLDMV